MQNNPSLQNLQQAFATIADPRRDHTKHHELLDIFLIAVCCLLCGGSGFAHMEQFGHAKLDWLRTFLALPNGIPSHDTFRRVALSPCRQLLIFSNNRFMTAPYRRPARRRKAKARCLAWGGSACYSPPR